MSFLPNNPAQRIRLIYTGGHGFFSLAAHNLREQRATSDHEVIECGQVHLPCFLIAEDMRI